MKRDRGIAWLALLVWLVALNAAQGTLVGERFLGSRVGAWLPDLALLVVLALAGRVPERELPRLALLAALARLAFATDPPAAVLAGFLGLVGATFLVRSVADLREIGARTLVAAGGVLAFDGWLVLVAALRVDPRAQDALLGAGDLVPAAFTSAACAFFAGPVVFKLPGLSPLARRRSF